MNEIERLILKSQTPPIRDRICEYCKKKFYAKHLSKIFCTDICADKNYNEKIRPYKQAMLLLKKRKEEAKRMEEYKKSLELPENKIKRTIEILNRLTIDPNVGTIYLIKEIAGLGVDFEAYSYKEKILGKVENAYALIFGNYRITKLDNTNLRIENILNKKK